MRKVKYKGYVISQSKNNHVMITKDDNIVFHANITKRLTDEELRNQLEWFIKFSNLINMDEG